MHFIQRRSSKALRSHWLEIGVRRGDARVRQRKHVLTKATLQDAGGVRISNCMGVRGEHGLGQNRLTASHGSTEIIFPLATDSARGAAELTCLSAIICCGVAPSVVIDGDRRPKKRKASSQPDTTASQHKEQRMANLSVCSDWS
ncbi:SUVC05G0645 [Saccharomyces uvarum]|uniref:SUVC05G0645 protein n=1 Tax=Saccharomyces uvarum TaxID=230603 RepID=A0AA35JF38_SACUV|nr:SUVC05G0645 [Saccharomyces uvarum]